MIWALLAAAVLILALWGWRQAITAADFFAASRIAGPWLAGIAGTAAGLSAFVFVGGPGLFAVIGFASLWIILSAPITGALQCWAVGETIVSMTRRHGCLTVPDLVAVRFGEGLPRGLAAAAVAIGGTATLTVQVKGLAVVGGVLTGAPGWAVAGGAVVATVTYTAAGGMRAGILAEAAQGVVMAAVAVGLAVHTLYRAGGPAAALATIAERRPELLDPVSGVGPMVALGWFVLFAVGTCAQPHYLHKFMMLRDRTALRLMPAVMTGALLAMLTVWIGLGAGGTALSLAGELDLAHPDEMTPALLHSAATPGLLLVAVVAVLAAVMSTAASVLSTCAAALTRDLPRALGRRPPEGLGSARLATVAVGLCAAAGALLSERPVALLGILGWGTLTASLLAPILIGLNWRGCTRQAAVAAMILGPAVQLGLEVARMIDGKAVGWEPALTGTCIAIVALVALSHREDSRHEHP